MIDILKDVTIDTAKLLPFLFITYLVMEYWEKKAGNRTEEWMKHAGPLGPVIGAGIGAIPQCGFSAMSSSLYAGGIISTGTLIAVFLSTSDEMLPLLISEHLPGGTIFRILAMKAVIGAVTGLFVDLVLLKVERTDMSGGEFHQLCEKEHCQCESGGIVSSAAVHTLKIAVFIYIISFIAAVAVNHVGKAELASMMAGRPVTGILLMSLIGLIPNCGASVLITQLYLEGLIRVSQMMAGLLTGSGVGLLVLFRTNRNMKENAAILGTMYAAGVFWGVILNAVGIAL
ncbi:MAG: putative manganese transporter [Anaerovoracaceae bacterium]